MKSFTHTTDPVYNSAVLPSAMDKLLLKLIRDPRDLPFVYLSIRITFTLWPLAIIMFIPGMNNGMWWTAAIAYQFFNNFVFKGPFGLMLHCTSHRVFFKKEYSFLNHYLPWVLGPLFGQTPETYYTHHIGMHHPENNMPEDESSTMDYQRDSLRSFSRYLGSFVVAGVYDLARYFLRKQRNKLFSRLVRGELIFYAVCIGLCFVNWPATLCVFILPFLISRVVMMLGNWAQHAFINPATPENPYTNSITCINTKYNHKCWNDGYHISHHIKPSMHWTEHPVYFKKTLQEYIDNDAIIFDGIHFLHVFAWLMRKRYDLLARHFVNLNNRFESDEAVIIFLRERTRKIPEALPVAV
ncbi:Fatty acid desaturase [Chitinophaga costaii]|uniref:Fatty acid desaturase n=1 Tax=Chitinophaga costaii TaxID=1335309 RepID=A0A1C4DMQ7_9BACT|nr:fatty acid desaturase [Chitinophaga costaii]PUZ27702.1 fatty acid desaturase [Chitinophaga costaii]SCC32618.1 Fatty acid desaturase [Chitinophaga costaii]